MESTVVDANRLIHARNWGYAAHSRNALDVDAKLKTSKYPISVLGEHITGLAGGLTPKGASYPDSGVPFIRVGNIQPHGLDLRDVKYIDEELHNGELRRSQLQGDDVLLAITGATFGKACVTPSEIGPANINQHIARIRTLADLNPHYLALFSNSELGTKQLLALATGGTRPALDYEAIRSIRIPLPPREVQDRIARLMQEAYATRQTKLAQAKTLLSEIDKTILSKLGVEVESLVNKKQFTINISSLRGHRFDIGPYSNNFDLERISLKDWVSLKDLAYLPSTSKIASKLPDNEFVYVGMTDVDDVTGEVNLHHLLGRQINSNKVAFKGGDIVFARIEPCIYNRKIALIPYEVEEGLGSTELYVARAREEVMPEFLLWMLRSELIQQQISGYMTGTTGRRRLPPKAFANLKIPKASKEMQNQIVREAASSRDLAKQLEKEAESIVVQAKAQVERMILGEEGV